MTLIVTLLLAFLVVVLAGNSMRRKGRWSRGAYLAWVGLMAVLCVGAAALLFFPRSAP